MSHTTMLGETQLTQSPHNVVTIELVAPDDMPATVKITWPLLPTVVDPRRFPDTAAVVARMFASASTELARIKAGRRL